MFCVFALCVLLIGSVTSLTEFTSGKKTKWKFDVKQISTTDPIRYRFQAKQQNAVKFATDMQKDDAIKVFPPKEDGIGFYYFQWDGQSSGGWWTNWKMYWVPKNSYQWQDKGKYHRGTIVSSVNKYGSKENGKVELQRDHKPFDVPAATAEDSAHQSYTNMMADAAFDDRASAQRGYGYGDYDYGYDRTSANNNGGMSTQTMIFFITLASLSLLCCACVGLVSCVIGYAASNYYIGVSQARRKDATYDELERSQA